MKEIFTGIISEKELVKTFGTKKQIAVYEDNDKFIGCGKATILRNARQYCDVADLGNRQYEISNIKEIPMTKAYARIHDDLYKYICPLLLKRLVTEEKPMTFTMGHWAREISMVNENYPLVKYNMDEAIMNITPLKGTPKSLLIDYYNCADSMVYSYMTQALKYLSDLGLVIWREVYMISTKKIKSSKIVCGEVKVELETETHQASEEEMDFYAKCVGKADYINNIKENCTNERYYSEKSKRWAKSLQTLLEKKHIDKVYKSYEVYSTSYEKCRKVLNMYKTQNQSVLIDKFNIAFTDRLNENAGNRYLKNPDKYDKQMLDDDDKYLDGYANIAEFTIDDNVESCRYIIER